MEKTTPRINYNYYEKKCKELDDAINSKKEKNIAISGIYGSGKSSLILTYDKTCNNKKFKKEKILQETDQDKLDTCLENIPYDAKKKSLTISLANFNIINDKQLENQTQDDNPNNENAPIKSKNELDEKEKIALELSELDKYNKQLKSQYNQKNKQLIEQQIEQSLLQQFLFSVDSRKLPASKVKRVMLKSNCSKVSYGFLCFALFILCLYLINFFSLLWQQNQIMSKVLIILELLSLLVLFCLLPLVLKIKSVKLRDLEFIKADPEIKDSLINRYIDEIIYFFEKSKVKIVYFEDLDRLPDLSIFNKLRELNYILNNNLNNKKHKISFVYCISDSIITDYEERSKFFDRIISIEPFFTEATITIDIEKLLKANGAEQVTEFSTDMAKFIPDKRLYINIENDFKDKINSFILAYKHNPNETEIIKIFAISVYKNIYYFDYNKFNTGKSCLSKAFALINYLRQEFIEENQKQIDLIDENNNFNNNNNINNINFDIKRKRENFYQYIQIAKAKPVKTFMRINDCDLIKNDFIYICLFKGYIENDFLRYVFFDKADMLLEDDSIFVRLNNLGEIQSPAKNNYSYKLFDLDKVVDKIYTNNFDTDNILNYDLVNWLLKRNPNNLEDKYRSKQNILSFYLKSNNSSLYDFYCKFLIENGKQEIKNLINFVYDSVYFLTAFKDDLNKLETDKQNFILNCLFEQDFENINEDNKLILLEILNKHTDWANIELSANLIDRLKYLGKLQIETFNGLSDECCEIVKNKVCFAINYKNLNLISQKFLNNNTENNILLSLLDENTSDDLRSYILTNLDTVLESIPNNQNLNESTIKYLLKLNFINEKTTQQIIENYNFIINDISDLDEEYINLIIEKDKLAYDIETIFEVFINYEDIDLYKYFTIENYSKLNLENKNNVLNNENFEQFKEFLIENFLLADNAVKIFTDFNINEIELNNQYETISESKLSNLIKQNLIAFSINNFNCLINCYDAYFELLKQNEEEYINLIENTSTNGLVNDNIITYVLSKTTNLDLQTYIINNLSNLINFEFSYNNIICVDNILMIIKDKQLKSSEIIINLFNFMNIDRLKEQRLELLENNCNLLTPAELIFCLKKIGQDFENCDIDKAELNKTVFIERGLKLLKNKAILKYKKITNKEKFKISLNKTKQ